jgi:hypothetical protein
MSKIQSHNLNIHMYKLTEILDLFQLSYNISIDDLKRAKKTVLMTHPDKSGLGAEYFLFYKKAFDVVVNFYNNQQKQNQVVPTEEPKYEPINANNINKSTKNKISSVIQEMSPNEFNSKFNKLFDDNMSSKPNSARNEWFTKDEPSYHVEGDVNKQNMGIMFEKMKEQQNTNVLSRYRGVENFNSGSGSKLYDDEENEDYVVCDPFSKLKFDDLRKVHKDQTVLAVSEKDYSKVPRYSSMDQYKQVRGQQTLTPLDKTEAERLLSTQEQEFKQRIMQKEYQSNLRTMEYEQKNKTVLSSFLQLKNY